MPKFLDKSAGLCKRQYRLAVQTLLPLQNLKLAGSKKIGSLSLVFENMGISVLGVPWEAQGVAFFPKCSPICTRESIG